jgi:hypothetical protein
MVDPEKSALRLKKGEGRKQAARGLQRRETGEYSLILCWDFYTNCPEISSGVLRAIICSGIFWP